MWILALACAFFLSLHLLVSSTILRSQLVEAIGHKIYLILFSALSLIVLLWVIQSYGAAKTDPSNWSLWSTGQILRWLLLPLNLLATALMLLGLFSPKVTGMVAPGTLPAEATGISRISRHPVLSGVTLWAIGHLLTNADLASFLFFGTFLTVAVLGMISIDHKRAARYGAAWNVYLAQTSRLPFVAILQGRNRLEWRELGRLQLFWAGSLVLTLLVLHEFLFTGQAY
ncbi:MAG: NnrU family protein [Asticcacaulis sp.]